MQVRNRMPHGTCREQFRSWNREQPLQEAELVRVQISMISVPAPMPHRAMKTHEALPAINILRSVAGILIGRSPHRGESSRLSVFRVSIANLSWNRVAYRSHGIPGSANRGARFSP